MIYVQTPCSEGMRTRLGFEVGRGMGFIYGTCVAGDNGFVGERATILPAA